MLRVVVLGAAAGGGVPQWNCGCPVCKAARTENPELQSTQASIAVSADGDHWFLVNASPDLRQQLLLSSFGGALLNEYDEIIGKLLVAGEVRCEWRQRPALADNTEDRVPGNEDTLIWK